MDAFAEQVTRSLRRASDEGAADHWLGRCPLWVRSVPLADGETCYAAYENCRDSPEDAIVATSLGLYLRRPVGWEFVGYRDIGQVAVLGEHTAAPMLIMRLRSGRVAALPVRGGREDGREAIRFRDFVEAMRCSAGAEPCVTTDPPGRTLFTGPSVH